MSVAEKSVDGFHHMLDAGQFEQVYDASSAEMKNASTKERFVELLSAVHRKLGAVKSSKAQGWNVNYNTSGNFVTLTYQSQFDGGSADEQFVYRLAGDGAQLAGYHINSDALITK